MIERDSPNVRDLPRWFTVGFFTTTLLLLLFNASQWLTRVPRSSINNFFLPFTLLSIGLAIQGYGMARQRKQTRALPLLSIGVILMGFVAFIAA